MKHSQALIDSCDIVTQILRSLAHPTRMKILCHLTDGEKTVNELLDLCGTSQSGVSQFLGRMKLEKLVDSRRDGQRVFYRIADPKMVQLLQSLKDIYCKCQKSE